MIIGITGFKHSGKDECANFIIAKTNRLYRKYSFAGPLKETVKVMFGWSDDMMHDQYLKEQIDPYWGISPREVLQWMGTDVARIALPDRFQALQKLVADQFWIKRFKRWLSDQNDDNTVIPDIRFQNEVDAVKALGGVMIRIKRASVVPKVISHPSEDVDILTGIDIVITNDGTIEDLWNNSGVGLEYIQNMRREKNE